MCLRVEPAQGWRSSFSLFLGEGQHRRKTWQTIPEDAPFLHDGMDPSLAKQGKLSQEEHVLGCKHRKIILSLQSCPGKNRYNVCRAYGKKQLCKDSAWEWLGGWGHVLLETAAGNPRPSGDTGTLAWQEGADLTPWFPQAFSLGETFILLYFLPGKKHLCFTSMRCHSVLNKKFRLDIFVALFCTLPFFHIIKPLTFLSVPPAPSAEVTNYLL